MHYVTVQVAAPLTDSKLIDLHPPYLTLSTNRKETTRSLLPLQPIRVNKQLTIVK